MDTLWQQKLAGKPPARRKTSVRFSIQAEKNIKKIKAYSKKSLFLPEESLTTSNVLEFVLETFVDLFVTNGQGGKLFQARLKELKKEKTVDEKEMQKILRSLHRIESNQEVQQYFETLNLKMQDENFIFHDKQFASMQEENFETQVLQKVKETHQRDKDIAIKKGVMKIDKWKNENTDEMLL